MMAQRWSIVAAAVLLAALATSAERAEVTRHDALVQLRDGNMRHIEGQVRDAAGSAQTGAPERTPLACIVTCSDLAVPVEAIFDQPAAGLHVIRLAGPVMPAEVVASVEYAVEQWTVPLVIVLGHAPCETVDDAVISEMENYAGPALSVLSRLQRSVSAARHKGFSEEEMPSAAINENARMGAQALLDGSRLIEEAVLSDSLIVLAAVYDESSGQVKWLTQVTAASVGEQARSVSAKPIAAAPPITTQPAPQVAEKKTNVKKDVKKTSPQPVEEESSTYARRHR